MQSSRLLLTVSFLLVFALLWTVILQRNAQITSSTDQMDVYVSNNVDAINQTRFENLVQQVTLIQSQNDKIFKQFSTVDSNVHVLRKILVSILCTDKDAVMVTGAWCLFVNERGEMIDPGPPFKAFTCPMHHVPADAGLAPFLQTFFGTASVLDIGAGVGQYEAYWRQHNAKLSSLALDGAINVPEYTHGFVQWVDFTSPIFLNGSPFDWVMALEIGEHIPAQYEEQFFENLHNNNICGIVLSWGVVGQHGHSHVNLKSNEDVVGIMKKLGYSYDIEIAQRGRKAARNSWFRDSFMVFHRDERPNCK